MCKQTLLYLFLLISTSTSLAQGRLSVGFDLASRKEIRSYHDPQGYLHRQYTPLFAIGGSLSYMINDRWEIESGLYETSFHQTVSAYYKEPGYIPLSGTGWQVNGLKTLQIPLRGIYNLGLGWKRLSIAALGGINIYTLSGSLKTRGEAGLSAIPVYPTAPTSLMIYYESYPLRKSSLAFELGGQVKYQISNRLNFIYRFTALAGTRDMIKMEGYYEIDNPPTHNPFEVTSKGSALHHTFSLRYRMGKKKEKQNWWEYED